MWIQLRPCTIGAWLFYDVYRSGPHGEPKSHVVIGVTCSRPTSTREIGRVSISRPRATLRYRLAGSVVPIGAVSSFEDYQWRY